MVTSGEAGAFPAGLPVGTVHYTAQHVPEVEPAAQLDRLVSPAVFSRDCRRRTARRPRYRSARPPDPWSGAHGRDERRCGGSHRGWRGRPPAAPGVAASLRHPPFFRLPSLWRRIPAHPAPTPPPDPPNAAWRLTPGV